MFGSTPLSPAASSAHSPSTLAEGPRIDADALHQLEVQLNSPGTTSLPQTQQLMAAMEFLRTGSLAGFEPKAPPAPTGEDTTASASASTATASTTLTASAPNKVQRFFASLLGAPPAAVRPAALLPTPPRAPSLPELLAPMHQRGVPFEFHLGMQPALYDCAPLAGVFNRGLSALPTSLVRRHPFDRLQEPRHQPFRNTSTAKMQRIGVTDLRRNECALLLCQGGCSLAVAKDDEGQLAVIHHPRLFGKPAHPAVEVVRGRAAADQIDRALALATQGSHDWAVVVMPQERPAL